MLKALINSKNLACILGTIFFTVAPLCVSAQASSADEGDPTQSAPATASSALLRDGVFGCGGARYSNPGTLAAIGGVYVPVNDAAVTLNTGYLVYKECVLDGVSAKIGEAARTELVGSTLRSLNTGRNGQSLFVKSQSREIAEGQDGVVLAFVTGDALNVMSEAFRADVQRILARRHLQSSRQPEDILRSTFPGGGEELRAFVTRQSEFTFEKFLALREPANIPINAAFLAQVRLDEQLQRYEQDQREQWMWGNGFYAVMSNEENPRLRQILTPSYVVSQGAQQAVTSGFRCLEGADELSEVCAPLFAGLVSQLMNDTRGLEGITRAASGLPSYVNRMVSEASAAVRAEAVNAAIGILSVARQTEALYRVAKEGSATIITNAINRLRSAERTCWNLIMDNVCVAGSYTPTTRQCTAQGDEGGQLVVSTSTAFSQAVITSRIAPLATEVAADLQASEQALSLLDQLIVSVTDSASATNQRQALERLDTLVANNQLHNGNDVTAARAQTDSITGLLSELVERTLSDWGDSPDGNIGWCNVNNPGVIEFWKSEWRQ